MAILTGKLFYKNVLLDGSATVAIKIMNFSD